MLHRGPERIHIASLVTPPRRERIAPPAASSACFNSIVSIIEPLPIWRTRELKVSNGISGQKIPAGFGHDNFVVSQASAGKKATQNSRHAGRQTVANRVAAEFLHATNQVAEAETVFSLKHGIRGTPARLHLIVGSGAFGFR